MLSNNQWYVLHLIHEKKGQGLDNSLVHLGTITSLYIRDLIVFKKTNSNLLLSSFGKQLLKRKDFFDTTKPYHFALKELKEQLRSSENVVSD